MDVYEIVTERIIKRLKEGDIPWKKPWMTSRIPPSNLFSKKPYQGVNILLTSSTGYASPYWVTYKQAKDLGGNVKQGEKAGTIVVFYKLLETKETNSKGKPITIPFLRYSSVFNSQQCNGLEIPEEDNLNPLADFKPIPACEEILKQYKVKGPTIKENMDRACYSPFRDEVHMPSKSTFDSEEGYYTTIFHELGHSTGHKSRLNRDIKALYQSKHDYSKEELVAEMTACYLSNLSGIEQRVEDNSVAYLQGWIRALKGDKKFLVTAASKAQKAADYIQNVNGQQEVKEAA